MLKNFQLEIRLLQDHILLLESDKVDDDDDVVLLKIVRNLSPIANRLLVFYCVNFALREISDSDGG